jgi:hypothetical protein
LLLQAKMKNKQASQIFTASAQRGALIYQSGSLNQRVHRESSAIPLGESDIRLQ